MHACSVRLASLYSARMLIRHGGEEGDLEAGEAAKLREAAEGEALHHQDVYRHAHLRRPKLSMHHALLSSLNRPVWILVLIVSSGT